MGLGKGLRILLPTFQNLGFSHPKEVAKGSVDTPLTGVDTMLQTQGKIMKKWSSSVDTGSSSVDTRPSSQRTQSTGLYKVSTQNQVVSTQDQVVSTQDQDQVVSTLEAFPENHLGQFGTVCRHTPWAGRHTPKRFHH
ncbi:hypothetical protein Taro_052968 [Colocasia esculenta]|uniref:Uncharacterized protein n=1 Tax=Colocasia esculenta TaxID=4460 RepID=A0A843XLM4_COLES|nr:hypothetical protein [Colocasia esculenta]